jgi:hypothetical protein
VIAPATTFSWPAIKSVGGYTAPVSALPTGGATGTLLPDDGATFRAGAVGAISATFNAVSTASYWTVDEQKNMVEQRRGY